MYSSSSSTVTRTSTAGPAKSASASTPPSPLTGSATAASVSANASLTTNVSNTNSVSSSTSTPSANTQPTSSTTTTTTATTSNTTTSSAPAPDPSAACPAGIYGAYSGWSYPMVFFQKKASGTQYVYNICVIDQFFESTSTQPYWASSTQSFANALSQITWLGSASLGGVSGLNVNHFCNIPHEIEIQIYSPGQGTYSMDLPLQNSDISAQVNSGSGSTCHLVSP